MAINSINYYAAYARAISNISNSVNRSSALYGNWYANLYGGRYGTGSGSSVNSVSGIYGDNGNARSAAERLLQNAYFTKVATALQTTEAERALQWKTENASQTSSTRASSDAVKSQWEQDLLANGTTAYGIARTINRAFEDASQSKSLAESTAFVKEYAQELRSLKTAAEDVRSNRLMDTLGTVTETGEYGQENIDKAVAAVENLVQQYNRTDELLTKNLDRGSGVQRQVTALRQKSLSEEQMEQVGLGYNADGRMVFREEAFRTALSNASQADKADGTRAHMTTITDSLDRMANQLARASSAGLMRNSSSLINNDLKEINNQRVTAAINAWNNIYSRNGVEVLAGAGSFFSAIA